MRRSDLLSRALSARFVLLGVFILAVAGACRTYPTLTPTRDQNCGWQLTSFRLTLDSVMVATDSLRSCTEAPRRVARGS